MREGAAPIIARDVNREAPSLLARLWLRTHVLRVLLPSGRLIITLALFLVIIGGGTSGYVALSDLSSLDAFYQTIITLSTVGYAEVEPFDRDTRIFTSALIVLGVGTALYALSAMAQELFDADLQRRLYLGRERMRIEQLRGHAIVCGYGRVGYEIAGELRRQGAALVIIELREERARSAREDGYLVVEGDATEDPVLQRAGIDAARTLLAAGDDDSRNTFITLTAKALNPDCRVVARVAIPENRAKLELAGADRTVSPYRMGARRMAFSALWPATTDASDALEANGGEGLVFVELRIDEMSGAAGRACGELLAGTSATLLGVRHGAEVVAGPPPDRRLEAGDILMLLGDEHAIATIGSRT